MTKLSVRFQSTFAELSSLLDICTLLTSRNSGLRYYTSILTEDGSVVFGEFRVRRVFVGASGKGGVRGSFVQGGCG